MGEVRVNVKLTMRLIGRWRDAEKSKKMKFEFMKPML